MLVVAVLVLVLVLVVGAVQLYLWRRLVRDTLAPGRGRRVAGLVLGLLALLIPAALVGGRLLPRGLLPVLAWPGYLWLGLLFYLLVTLVLLEPLRLALFLLARRRPAQVRTPAAVGAVTGTGAPGGPGTDIGDEAASTVPDPRRRLLLGQVLAATAGAASLTAVGVGTRRALGPPDLRRVSIPLAKLPSSMNGFRIALVSDIHLGPLSGRAHTERIVRLVNGLDADLVAVVGDLVDGGVDELGAAAEPLQDLRARHGSFFVTGNHEYYSGYRQWVDRLPQLGLRVLRNERVALDGIDLAGVNDVTGGQYRDAPDYRAALSGRDPGRAVVLLAHQPVQAHEAARWGADLQLSGHTHGGQMVPFNLAVRAQQPVVAGLGRVDGMPVYVTRGAGFWGPPVRFGAPPEISVVDLRSTR